jgi:hypothetical protein
MFLSGTSLNVYFRIVDYGITIFLQVRSRMLRGKAKIATLILASFNYLMQNCINLHIRNIFILNILLWNFYLFQSEIKGVQVRAKGKCKIANKILASLNHSMLKILFDASTRN